MVERIRFHLDENVTLAVALGLRRYGIDVLSFSESEERAMDAEDPSLAS